MMHKKKEKSFSNQYGTDAPRCTNCTIHGHPRTFWQRLGRFRPDTFFDVSIRLPFFGVENSCMTYVFERREWVYFLFEVKFFKWSWQFRLGKKGL